jgi:hypothetical protein
VQSVVAHDRLLSPTRLSVTTRNRQAAASKSHDKFMAKAIE